MAIAGAIALAQWRGWLPDQADNGTSRKSGPVVQQPATPKAEAPAGSRKIGGWEELHGCTLIEDRGNDGDSFIARHNGEDLTLRLYFADCPEKYRHQYNGDRIADQGRYFGGLTEQETIRIGEAAREFSLGLLRNAPFTVLTRRERVFDSERVFSFVTVGQGDLAELLVMKGLARIYTKGGDRPGKSSSANEKRHLLGLESKARKAGKGAWAVR